jgi:hypothetical protein
VGIPKWTQQQTTERDMQRWWQQSDYGICMQTRVVRAHGHRHRRSSARAAVRDTIAFVASLPAWFRAGHSGKCLLAFRMPGAFAKRVIKTAHGIIEFLATGQQFVAARPPPERRALRVGRTACRDGDPRDVARRVRGAVAGAGRAVRVARWRQSRARRHRALTARTPRRRRDDPTVTWLAENGWVMEYERDGRVDVRCPWEHEHTMDSGPTARPGSPRA